MSLYSILETLLIGPLKLLFEIIFQTADRFVSHPGISIIFLSLAMNILVLPLYKRADAMQEESRLTEERLGKGIAHIKKTFSGDEKMMILQAYYRQNHYSPANALKGSTSLLLEIPFFMAAYQFLSHLKVLEGVSLGPIADLSAPDSLIVIGGFAINVLPILMTLINIISSALYLKGFPLKTKIQLYAMAGFFLVFLYTSPSGLVFYWTLNNLFSLVKNIFYKIKNPTKVLRYLTAVLGIGMIGLALTAFGFAHPKKMLLTGALGVALLLPLALELAKKYLPKKAIVATDAQPNKKLFLWGSIFMTVLVGVLIPATIITASPQEFVDATYFHNPLWYLVSSGAMAAGFFLVWLRVFYWLANQTWKVIFERLVWIACGVMLVNYMFFGTELGILSSTLQYESGMIFTRTEKVLNLVVDVLLAAVLWLVVTRFHKVLLPVLLTGSIALGAMSGIHIFTIFTSVNSISAEQEGVTPSFQLSTEGKNVVVVMLDRAMGAYVPYLFNERPELVEQFDGFTYYDNTISFGGHTNVGSPALLGGYEYTPVELNKKDDQSLMEKQNESVLLMPRIFNDADYNVTVFDPVYANYQWLPDLTVFDPYPEINAFVAEGAFSDPEQKEAAIQNNHRNFFCFSLMKTLPVILQPELYRGGTYNQAQRTDIATNYGNQTWYGPSVGEGMNKSFMDAYNVLCSLPWITEITEDSSNNFLYMTNNATHSPMILEMPDYTPVESVDNTAYDAAHTDRFVYEGNRLVVDMDQQMACYHTNMAAMLQLGKWFDTLREAGVYDNTKIILVSDHGYNWKQLDALIHENGTDYTYYYPLLMVKDFDAEGFTTSHEFMTNADVPTIAFADCVKDPVNPFTGNPINNDEKTAHDQFIIVTEDWDVYANNGNAFLPATWASVKEDLWNHDNWNFYDELSVLKEHAFPTNP